MSEPDSFPRVLVPNDDGTATVVIPADEETAAEFRTLVANGFSLQEIHGCGTLIYGIDFLVERDV
ncbi:hypothetical protein FHT44_005205 [Mycolicibacterium sp. BK634]|uniref:hypothetical protein n=1 Tax=Mycolicibacterium sp. BK634 TaxID=2587099 RepID=UPI00161DBFC4|nr:hypothetical protein [Mycolicibacterium sp. BK634]MBB3752693.1 hypothetical protein [Mycolicibacterium sp. BK634]